MNSVGTLFAIARRHWLMLLCWTLLGGAVTSGLNLLIPAEYEASARMLVVAPDWNDMTALADPNYGGATPLAYGDEFTQMRVASYAKLLDSPMVTAPVVQRLHLGMSAEELGARVTAHIVPDTVIMDIQVKDRSATQAALIADEMARQLIVTIREIERPANSRYSPVQPVLMETASVPNRPVSPRTLLYIASGMLVGFLIGLTYLALREGRSLALLTASDSDDEILGILSSDDLGDEHDADAAYAELQLTRLIGKDPSSHFVLVAPRGSTTPTLVARRLAAVMSLSRRRPVIVIADPAVDLGESGAELGAVTAGSGDVDDIIVVDPDSGVEWIPLGDAASTVPAATVRQIATELSARGRTVLVVAPAILESVRAVDLAGPDSAAVLVTSAPGTSVEEIREAERLTRMTEGSYLGRIVVTTDEFAEQAVAEQT